MIEDKICIACGEPTMWIKTISGATLILDPMPKAGGRVSIVDTGNAFGGDRAVRLKHTFTDRDMYDDHVCRGVI